MLRSLIGFVLLFLMISCSEERNNAVTKRTKVNAHLENAYNRKVVLESVPILDQKLKKLDSASIKDRVQTQVFEISDSVENLYQIRIANSPLKFVFINDEPEIDIYFYFPDSVKVKRSPATESLHEFLLKASSFSGLSKVDLLRYGKDFASENRVEQQKAYRNFVDTVSSPAAALYVFNNVDYGNDYTGLKIFINRLHNRFPNHPGIGQLKKETEEYISIFEQEIEINDIAPDLILPDTSGNEFSLSSFKGKYVLLDFWAAWNSNSRIQSPDKVKAWNQYRSRNFTIVSVSLDPDLEYWKKVIVTDKYGWPQMNDPNVWSGRAIKAYKFDSIPFNFLIDPHGKIVAKAIYGDSLFRKLSDFLP